MFIFKRCKCHLTDRVFHSIQSSLKTLEQDLKLFSVKSRLELLYIINLCNHCVSDIVEHTGMSQSLTSHHLADLAQAGFIQGKRDGKCIDYELTNKGEMFVTTLDYLMQGEKGGESIMSFNPLRKFCECLCKCCKKCKECCGKNDEERENNMF